MVKIIFCGVAVAIVALAFVAIKMISSCAIWMDDSFRWGGRDGNG